MSMVIAHLPPADVASFCDGLVAYHIVRVTGRLGVMHDERTWRLMARDIARPQRRYTNLDTGTEVMDLSLFITTVQATTVTVATEGLPDRPVVEITVRPGG